MLCWALGLGFTIHNIIHQHLGHTLVLIEWLRNHRILSLSVVLWCGLLWVVWLVTTLGMTLW